MIEYYKRMPKWGNVAGTMWSCIVDYSTFLHHLMNVDREKWKMMTAPQVVVGDAME